MRSPNAMLLTEEQVKGDIACLDEAWNDPQPFVLLPEKIDVAREWIRDGIRSLSPALKEDCFGLLTSGSTGRPKLIFGKRSRAEALARVLHEKQASDPVRETVLALPLSYCFAFVNQWVWSKVHQRKLVVTRGFRAVEELGGALSETNAGMICAVGAQMHLYSEHFSGRTFPRVIRVHFAGGQFPAGAVDEIMRLFPNAVIFNNYGCAEAMPRLTLRPWEGNADGSNVGFPLPGVEMRADDTGRILFQSRYGASAFFDEAGLRLISPGDWIPSGDIGEKLDDGSWRITGRANEVFKRYGEKIALPRLLKSVREVWQKDAAFYRTKDGNGEEGHVLVLSPSPTTAEVNAILQMFRKQYTRVLWPIKLESVASIPMLSNGKPDIKGLEALPNKTNHWMQRI